MANKIRNVRTYPDTEIGTGRVLPTRTVTFELSGQSLVSLVTYSGDEVSITVHNLTRDDVAKLVCELNGLWRSMNGNS
jgi:hypothetical protein